MLSFATEFPVTTNTTARAFLNAVRVWILGSPHTKIQSSDLIDMDTLDDWSMPPGPERVEVLFAQNEDTAAARYTRVHDGIEWTTIVVFRRIDNTPWITIRTSCESTYPQADLPQGKKPVVVRVLLDKLGAGRDGALLTQPKPHVLGDHDIDTAAALINGTAGCRLPVVYCSVSFDSKPGIDVHRVARELSGMAHIVVEPNRPFSQRLRIAVEHNNVYGGTVGVYWPDGTGRRAFYIGPEFRSLDKLTEAVCDEVRTALANRRPLEGCTWAAVQGMVSHRRVQELQASGSNAVQSYIENFEGELEAAKEQRRLAEAEVKRLEAEMWRLRSRRTHDDGRLLFKIAEQDFYQAEVVDIIRDAIDDAKSRVPKDSRRQHVLDAFLNAHPATGNAAKYREKLKNALKDYNSMDQATRRTLVDIGFTISEEGKHYKLIFQNDDRYTFTLSKSGSDYRGGRNAASDIGKLLF